MLPLRSAGCCGVTADAGQCRRGLRMADGPERCPDGPASKDSCLTTWFVKLPGWSVRRGGCLSALVAVFAVVGGAIGGQGGMVIALALAVVMNFVMYFVSPAVVLRSYNAQMVGPQEAPGLLETVDRLRRRAGLPTANWGGKKSELIFRQTEADTLQKAAIDGFGQSSSSCCSRAPCRKNVPEFNIQEQHIPV